MEPEDQTILQADRYFCLKQVNSSIRTYLHQDCECVNVDMRPYLKLNDLQNWFYNMHNYRTLLSN
jgi:hypothetical protein